MSNIFDIRNRFLISKNFNNRKYWNAASKDNHSNWICDNAKWFLISGKLVCSICRVRTQKMIHIPHPKGGGGGRSFWVKKINIQFDVFLRKSSLLWGMIQKNLICSDDDQERFYQNCIFHDLWCRGSCTKALSYKLYS